MKKIALLVILLLITVPAMAKVTIKAEQAVPGEPDVVISYESDEGRVRAFGIKVMPDNCTIDNVVAAKEGESTSDDPGYGIFVRNIDIASDGSVTSWGSPATNVADSNDIILEMGSLYVGEVNAPNSVEGELCTITVSGNCCLDIEEDGPSGGIVMEDGTSPAVVDVCDVCVTLYPACWDYPCQPYGDIDGDGDVDVADAQYFSNGWSGAYDDYPCADLDNDGDIDVADAQAFIDGWNNGCP
jgi:hypothetical protein